MAPPVPPEHITSDQDRLTQLNYENWLNAFNNFAAQQHKYYEAEMTKIRKSKKVRVRSDMNKSWIVSLTRENFLIVFNNFVAQQFKFCDGDW